MKGRRKTYYSVIIGGSCIGCEESFSYRKCAERFVDKAKELDRRMGLKGITYKILEIPC